MGVGCYHYALAASPQGMTWYPLYGRLDRPLHQSGCVEKLASTRIWSPDRPAYSKLLYWLCYLCPCWLYVQVVFFFGGVTCGILCSLKIGIIELKHGYIWSCSGMFVNCVTHKSWMALSSWPFGVQVAGRTNTHEMYAQHSGHFSPQRMTILTDIFYDTSQSL
jgi:hypothetical protein